jgi:hypothetical protein
MTPLSMRMTCRISGALLIAGFLLNVGGVVMYTRRAVNGVFATATYFNWERGLLMAAYIVSALGVAVLEIVLREAKVLVLARLGATAFLIAAIIAVVAEGEIANGQDPGTALGVVMVAMLFVAEAMLGGALILSAIFRAWVGWAVLVWNIGWPTILPIVRPGDYYFPILHFLALLLIGITALVPAHSLMNISEYLDGLS